MSSCRATNAKRAAAAERARIVAWLRARKEQIRLTGIGEYLDAIERGEHEDK